MLISSSHYLGTWYMPATYVLQFGKAFLSNLFQLANRIKPGQVWHINQVTKTSIAWWNVTQYTLARNFGPPAPATHRPQAPHLHRCFRLTGLQCMDTSSLVPNALALSQQPPLHCTQGALPDCHRLRPLWQVTDRLLCGLLL